MCVLFSDNSKLEHHFNFDNEPKVLICTKQPNFLLFKQPKSVNQFACQSRLVVAVENVMIKHVNHTALMLMFYWYRHMYRFWMLCELSLT